MGFSDNDHAIRELMRFIEMTISEFIFEDATRNGGAPNYKYRWLQTQKRFMILLYHEFEYRKSHTIKGDTMLKLVCATKCSNNHKHPQIHSQDSLHFTITLAVLRDVSSDSLDSLGASSDSPDPLVVGFVSP